MNGDTEQLTPEALITVKLLGRIQTIMSVACRNSGLLQMLNWGNPFQSVFLDLSMILQQLLKRCPPIFTHTHFLVA
jgi:hypothetical protein